MAKSEAWKCVNCSDLTTGGKAFCDACYESACGDCGDPCCAGGCDYYYDDYDYDYEGDD